MMSYLKFFVLAICIFEIEAQRKVAYTVNYRRCMTECKPEGDKFTCYLGMASYNWDYCTNTDQTVTSERSTTYYKKPVTSHCVSECMATATSNHWCFTSEDLKQWDYCSPKEGFSYRNNKCIQKCTNHYDYEGFVCDTDNGKESCSLEARDYSSGRRPKFVNDKIVW